MKEAIPVIATTITINGDTMPAWTAAWPITRAPTILTAWPTARGSLIPASRRASKVISITSASSTAGKGTPSLAAAMLIRSCVGIISW